MDTTSLYGFVDSITNNSTLMESASFRTHYANQRDAIQTLCNAINTRKITLDEQKHRLFGHIVSGTYVDPVTGITFKRTYLGISVTCHYLDTYNISFADVTLLPKEIRFTTVGDSTGIVESYTFANNARVQFGNFYTRNI